MNSARAIATLMRTITVATSPAVREGSGARGGGAIVVYWRSTASRYTDRCASASPTRTRRCETLSTVETFTPELAVLDIGLPGMDGYALARHLRQIPSLHTLRLVALTGYGQASDRQKSTEAGFDAHLVKPLHFPDLEAIIERK